VPEKEPRGGKNPASLPGIPWVRLTQPANATVWGGQWPGPSRTRHQLAVRRAGAALRTLGRPGVTGRIEPRPAGRRVLRPPSPDPAHQRRSANLTMDRESAVQEAAAQQIVTRSVSSRPLARAGLARHHFDHTRAAPYLGADDRERPSVLLSAADRHKTGDHVYSDRSAAERHGRTGRRSTSSAPRTPA